MALRPLGNARVFKDSRTGQLVVDKTTLRRGGGGGSDDAGDDFEGRRRRRRRAIRHDNEPPEDEDMGRDDWDDEDEDELDEDSLDGEDDLGDDDLGDDDLGEDDLGDDDLGDDEAGDDEAGSEVAGPRRRRRRRVRRQARKTRRQTRRARRKGGSVKWGITVLAAESNTPASAGDPITITIRPQHWFKARDVTFTGDSSAKIDTIFFGEKPVYNNSSGVPVSVFSSTGMLRGMLRGQAIRPGLDIIIKGTAGSTTATTATLIGFKPMNKPC